MVVTRRQSAAPPPPAASRTNSAQGVGTSRITSVSSLKGKNADRNNNDDNNNLNSISNHGSPLKNNNNQAGPSRRTVAETSSKASSARPRHIEGIKVEDDTPEPNNLPSEPPSSGKGGLSKAKPKTKSKKGSKTKKNRNEKSNKGIGIFDILARLFLLWFTIYTVSVCPEDVQLRSPICRALTEYRRLVLEPYILPPIHAALQNPTMASVIHGIQPVYSTAAKFTNPIVRRTRREWRMRVMPQVAWLRIRTRPYVRHLQRKYEATLGPYINNFAFRYRLHVQPHVDTAFSSADEKWRTVRPYVRPIWKAVKRLPGIILRVLVRLVIDARKKWVDPHVARIWAAIMEQESANREGTPVVESTDMAEVIDVITSVGVTPAPASTTPWDPVESDSLAKTISSLPIPPTFDVTDEIVASIIAETLSPSLHSPAEDSPTTPAADSNPPSANIDSEIPDVDFPLVTDEAAASAASIMAESLSLQGEKTSIVANTAVPNTTTEDDDEDLDTIIDEFLHEISATDMESDSSPAPEPSVHEETPEEKEERLRQQQIETATQRADLETRHTKWERDIEKLGRRQRKSVKEALTRLREAAANDARDPAGLLRKQVTDIVSEAERSLKGLSAFSKKLLAQEEKEDGEMMNEWNEVVTKVEKKFGGKVDNSAQTVREWLGERLQGEMREIETFATALTNLASEAQDDLGMGYTWLADVTYHDWQRYHKLLEMAKSFIDIYRGLQNGTEPDAPTNPLNDVIESLQEEMDDIIMGFQASIGQIRNTILDKPVPVDSGDANGRSGTVGTSGKTVSSDLPTEAEDPEPKAEMSILPIDVEEDETVVRDGNHKIPLGIIRSRDAEEVRQAIERAEGRVHDEM